MVWCFDFLKILFQRPVLHHKSRRSELGDRPSTARRLSWGCLGQRLVTWLKEAAFSLLFRYGEGCDGKDREEGREGQGEGTWLSGWSYVSCLAAVLLICFSIMLDSFDDAKFCQTWFGKLWLVSGCIDPLLFASKHALCDIFWDIQHKSSWILWIFRKFRFGNIDFLIVRLLFLHNYQCDIFNFMYSYVFQSWLNFTKHDDYQLIFC